MSRTRRFFACVAIAAMALTATAQPPFEPPPPGPVILNVLDSVGDKNLTAELKLNDDQLKKLTDYRKKGWDAAYTTAPAEFAKTQAERDKAAIAFLKEVLTPDQHTRATQLMAQTSFQVYSGWSPFANADSPAPTLNLVRVPASTFRQHPEIAEAAKLTAEQKKLVETPTRGPGFGGGFGGPGGGFGSPFGYSEPRVVLTPDQTESLKKFLGPIAKVGFRRFFDDRPQGADGPRFAGEDMLATLASRGVETELKLTDAQAKMVEEHQQVRNRFYTVEFNELSPEKAIAREKEMTEQAEKEIAKLLDKEQLTRLKQITLRMQMQTGPRPDPLAIYAIPKVAEGIGLSDDQKKALTAAASAYQAETLKALEADEPLDAVRKWLIAAAFARDAAVEKVITADQKTKLKDLIGAEFRDPRAIGIGPDNNISEILKRLRTAAFGRYSSELTTLSNTQAMKDDLKLDEEQVKKLAAAVAEYREKFGQGGFPGNQTQEEADKQAADQHAFVSKALDDILSADQRKRFRQLLIQYREQLAASGFGGGGGGGFNVSGRTNSPVALPGVAEEIKLTAEQKKKIIDGSEPNEVLAADQKATLKKLAGEAMKGEFNLPLRGGPRGFGPTRIMMLDVGVINPELKLTADQEYKIALALEDYVTRLRELNRGPRGGAAPSPKAQEEAVAVCEKAIDAVLTPEQKTRLAQLEVQAISSVTAAFERRDIAAKLAITPEQQVKLNAIRDEYRTRYALGSEASPRGGPFARFDFESYQKYQSMLDKLRQKARDQMLAELTEAQKAAWKELVGEPSQAVQSGRALSARGGFGGGGPRGIDP